MEYENGNWVINTHNDWPGVIYPEGHNWVDFTFAKLRFEWDKLMGGLEFEVTLLGLGLRVYYIYDRNTPARKEIYEMMDKLDEGKEHAP